MCKLFCICKDWHKLYDHDAFWQCAFVGMLHAEMARLQTFKGQEKRCKKLQKLLDKHMGAKSKFRNKGITTRQLVQRHRQAQISGKLIAKYTREIIHVPRIREELEAKWDTLLLDLSHVVKMEYQTQHILIRFCSDMERVKLFGHSDAMQVFTTYYKLMRKIFGNKFSLAQDCFPGVACLFSTHVVQLQDEIFFALFDDFLYDLQQRVEKLNEHTLRRAAMAKPSLAKLKKIVESNVMLHPNKYKYKFNCPFYEPLQPLLSFNYLVQADYLLELIVTNWDKYPEVHKEILPMLINYYPKSAYIENILELLPEPLDNPDEPVMNCLMWKVFKMPEDKLYFLLQKLINKGFLLTLHEQVLKYSCFVILLSQRLYSKQQAQTAINVLSMIKPYVNFNELHRGKSCFWLLRYYHEYDLHLLEWLLQNGADPNIRSENGECCLLALPQYTDAYILEPVVKIFFQYGLQLSSNDLDQCKLQFANWKFLGDL